MASPLLPGDDWVYVSRDIFGKFAGVRSDGSLWYWREKDPVPVLVISSHAFQKAIWARGLTAVDEMGKAWSIDPGFTYDPKASTRPARPVVPARNIINMESNYNGECLLLHDDTGCVWSMGSHRSHLLGTEAGRFGDRDTVLPPSIVIRDVRQLSTYDHHAMVILNNGDVRYWGGFFSSPRTAFQSSDLPSLIPFLEDARQGCISSDCGYLVSRNDELFSYGRRYRTENESLRLKKWRSLGLRHLTFDEYHQLREDDLAAFKRYREAFERFREYEDQNLGGWPIGPSFKKVLGDFPRGVHNLQATKSWASSDRIGRHYNSPGEPIEVSYDVLGGVVEGGTLLIVKILKHTSSAEPFPEIVDLGKSAPKWTASTSFGLFDRKCLQLSLRSQIAIFE